MVFSFKSRQVSATPFFVTSSDSNIRLWRTLELTSIHRTACGTRTDTPNRLLNWFRKNDKAEATVKQSFPLYGPVSYLLIKLSNNHITQSNILGVRFRKKIDYFCIVIKNKIMALEITDATFEETVLNSDKPVMVDFWAAWCGPCRMVGPIIDQISEEYDGKAVVGKVDVDANQEFAAKYGVRNIPTVLVFNKGELVGRQVGVAPKNVYAEAIDSLL
jgi:thioredoxin 1